MDVSAENKQLRWLLTFATAGGIVLALFLWLRQLPADDPTLLLPTEESRATSTVGDATTTAPRIAVDVVGAVVRPGVYYFDQGARVDDAINAAGGYAPDANRDAVNAAIRLEDEQQIRVPRVAIAVAAPAAASAVPASQAGIVAAPEVMTEASTTPDAAPIVSTPEVAPGVSDPSVPPGRLDINRANVQTLETLPEIGPVMAQRIVDYRATHGLFESIDQLQDIPGIGPATLDAIRDFVTINP